MKKAMALLVVAKLAACAIPAVAATGSSEWFFVDTTDKANRYEVHFNPNDDEDFPVRDRNCMANQEFVVDVEQALTKNCFEREGFDFGGWVTHSNAVAYSYKDGQVVKNLTYEDGKVVEFYALWIPRRVTVTFHDDHLVDSVKHYEVGMVFRSFDVPWLGSTAAHWDGWFSAETGERLTLNKTRVPAHDIIYNSRWTEYPSGGEVPEPVPGECCVTFDANGGEIGEGELFRMVVVAQRLTFGEIEDIPMATREGHTFDGWFTAASGGSQVTEETIVTNDVTLYAHWTANGGGSGGDPGTGEGATGGGDVVGDGIAGRLNVSFAKAQTVLGALYGRDGVPVGTVQVKVGKVSKKGEVKISASATVLADGKAKKVSAKAVSVILDATGRVPPVKVAFAAPIGEMAFEMTADGTFTLKNGSYVMEEKSVGGNWTRAGARVWVDGGRGATALPAGTVEELLPAGEPVIPKAGKWSFAKAATVKWAKPKKGAERPEIFDEASGKGLIVDDSKGKTNLSGMKLTYTPKTGIFKGSFKIYAIQGGKLKKVVVKVIGVVVDGKGSGSATGPGGVSFAVTVE